jgi:hypothetical protein
MPYQSAILNPAAHAGLATAIRARSHDVQMVMDGPSHLLHSGNGQHDNRIRALYELGYPFVTSPIVSPSEGAVFNDNVGGGSHSLYSTGSEATLPGTGTGTGSGSSGSGVGYGIHSSRTIYRAARTAFPADLRQFLLEGWNGSSETHPGRMHHQGWLGLLARTDAGVGIQTDGSFPDVLGQNDDLRGWVAVGDAPGITGNLSILWRQGSGGPNQGVINATIKTVAMGRAAGVYTEFADLLATDFYLFLASRQYPNPLNLVVSSTLSTHNMVAALGAFVENKNRAWGFGVSPHIAYAGASMRNIADQVVDGGASLHEKFFYDLLQNCRVGKSRKYLVSISVGHNDRNDTAISFDSVNNSDTAAGFYANVLEYLAQKQSQFSDFGVPAADVYFMLRVDQPVSFPDDAKLIAYRAILAANLPTLTALQCVVVDSMSLGTASEYAAWWLSPGSDQVHLNATGYYQIELRQMQGWFGALLGSAGRSRSRSRQR